MAVATEIWISFFNFLQRRRRLDMPTKKSCAPAEVRGFSGVKAGRSDKERRWRRQQRRQRSHEALHNRGWAEVSLQRRNSDQSQSGSSPRPVHTASAKAGGAAPNLRVMNFA